MYRMAVMGVWVFILICVPGTDDIKEKNKKPWKHTKQIFPEQKTKIYIVLHHLFPEHEVLIISGQLVSAFGQGKCTFDYQSGNLKNYASGNHVSTSSCMLRIEILITYVDISYKFTLAWVIVSHACTQITISTSIKNLVSFTVIIHC